MKEVSAPLTRLCQFVQEKGLQGLEAGEVALLAAQLEGVNRVISSIEKDVELRRMEAEVTKK